jgi:hypothetical protein
MSLGWKPESKKQGRNARSESDPWEDPDPRHMQNDSASAQRRKSREPKPRNVRFAKIRKSVIRTSSYPPAMIPTSKGSFLGRRNRCLTDSGFPSLDGVN